MTSDKYLMPSLLRMRGGVNTVSIVVEDDCGMINPGYLFNTNHNFLIPFIVHNQLLPVICDYTSDTFCLHITAR